MGVRAAGRDPLGLKSKISDRAAQKRPVLTGRFCIKEKEKREEKEM